MVTESPFPEAYRAALEGALVLDRFHLTTIAVRGKDRESFLQNMLTNDVRSLARGAGIPAAFLTNKGKLVSDLLVLQVEDAILLGLERERAEPLRAALDRYVVSEDVVLESGAETDRTISLEGPKASEILAGLAGISAAELDSLPHLHHRSLNVSGIPVLAVARRGQLTPRFDVNGPADGVREILGRALERGALLGGEAVRETRRIEAGEPRFGIDMDDSHLPLEAGLDDALSFQKGCYIGQEYVVRLAHRGQLNRKLSGLKLPSRTRVPQGAVVARGGEEVGTVTSSAFSPAFSSVLALAYLKRGHWEPGTEVTVEGVPAAVSSPRGGWNRDIV
jgi:folate-binding protein YgfZ